MTPAAAALSDASGNDRCAQALVLNEAVGRYNQMLSPLRTLRADLMNRDTAEYRQEIRTRLAQEGIGDAALRAASLAEWDRYFREIEEFRPQLNETIRSLEERLRLFTARVDEVFQTRGCRGTGFESAYQALHRDMRDATPPAAPRNTDPRERETAPTDDFREAPFNSFAGPNAALNQRIRDEREALDNEFRNITPEENARRAELEERLRRATMLMTPGFGSGSFADVRQPGGEMERTMLSAHHVPAEDHMSEQNPNLARLNYYLGNQTPAARSLIHDLYAGLGSDGSVDFTGAPIVTRHGDVVARPFQSPEALQLVPEGTLPQVGQVFYAVGYPASRGGVFTTYRCTYVGDAYGLTEIEVNAHAFDCPGIRENIGGMSGGPIVDTQGRVYGVLSGVPSTQYQNVDRRLLYAPVYQRNDGGLGTGLQPQVANPNCMRYGTVGDRRYTCSIPPR